MLSRVRVEDRDYYFVRPAGISVPIPDTALAG